MAQLREPGRRGHRDERSAEESLIEVVANQPRRPSLTQQDERKLPDLRERNADDDGLAQSVAEQTDGERAQRRFADENQEQQHANEDGLSHEGARVEQHADRYEEKSV